MSYFLTNDIRILQNGYHINGSETGRNCSDVFLPIPEFKRNSVPLTKEENRGNFLRVPEKIPVRSEQNVRIRKKNLFSSMTK